MIALLASACISVISNPILILECLSWELCLSFRSSSASIKGVVTPFFHIISVHDKDSFYKYQFGSI